MGRTVNRAGLTLIKQLEGCVLTAYKLKGEKYFTIGYGHSYDSSIKAGMVISKSQAEAYLRQDLKKFEGYVEKYVTNVTLNDNQFSALVSYCYNRGLGKDDGSNGLRQLIRHSSTLVEYNKNMVVYWGTATTYKDALIARRVQEQKLFNSLTTNVITPAISTTKMDNIKIIQKWLNEYTNSKIKVDGYWGDVSQQTMIKAIQIAINEDTDDDTQQLKVDGVAGNKTFAALTTLRISDVGSLVKCYEGLLYVCGYNPQNFSGVFTTSVKATTKEYQADHKLSNDGIVGQMTWKDIIL